MCLICYICLEYYSYLLVKTLDRSHIFLPFRSMRGMHSSVRVTKECQVSNGLSEHERHPYCSNERRFSIGLERDGARRGSLPLPARSCAIARQAHNRLYCQGKRPPAPRPPYVRQSVRVRPSLPSSPRSSHRSVTPRSPLYFVSISRVSRYVRARRCARLILGAPSDYRVPCMALMAFSIRIPSEIQRGISCSYKTVRPPDRLLSVRKETFNHRANGASPPPILRLCNYARPA